MTDRLTYLLRRWSLWQHVYEQAPTVRAATEAVNRINGICADIGIIVKDEYKPSDEIVERVLEKYKPSWYRRSNETNS